MAKLIDCKIVFNCHKCNETLVIPNYQPQSQDNRYECLNCNSKYAIAVDYKIDIAKSVQ